MPTNMLVSLVIHNSSVITVYMESIADMKCQIHQFNLESCFMNQKQETISDINVSIYVPILQLR